VHRFRVTAEPAGWTGTLPTSRRRSCHFRVVIDGETTVAVPRTTTSAIHRYKANATHRGKLLP